MAFTVNFYTFSKRVNSTKRPVNPAVSVSCVLKDNSGVLNPVLEVSINTNPQGLNYAYIPQFDRYYWVNEWTWIIGRWEVSLSVDALATYQTQIGNSEHYVLRSSYRYNKNIIDDLYPALSWQPNYYYDTNTFNFHHDFSFGTYILGVVNRDTSGIGAMAYYVMSSAQIRTLVDYMLPTLAENWLSGFNQMSEAVYRSIYDPFNYIKSCKWFPIGYVPNTSQDYVKFGNYAMNETGHILQARTIDTSTNDWYSDTRTVQLPLSWTGLDARERTRPYANIYLVCNPWGVIELNPLDFTDTRTIKLTYYIDFISGNALLKIYKVVGSTDYFITQKNARISIDVNLTQSLIDASGVLRSSAGFVGSAVSAVLSGGSTAVLSAVSAGASVTSAICSGVPSLSSSVGQSFDDAISIDGNITLIYQNTYFASEDNAENGKPLCETAILNTIPGYIKCLHGEIAINGAFSEELETIKENLTGGFFFET